MLSIRSLMSSVEILHRSLQPPDGARERRHQELGHRGDGEDRGPDRGKDSEEYEHGHLDLGRSEFEDDDPPLTGGDLGGDGLYVLNRSDDAALTDRGRQREVLEDHEVPEVL